MPTVKELLLDIKESSQKQALNGKEVLTIEEAAIYTGYEKETLQVMISRKQIPHSRPTKGKPFFLKSELVRWMVSNPIRTAMDLEQEAASYIIRNKRN